MGLPTNNANVQFNHRSRANFNSITPNDNTFYVVEETDGSKNLYLGNTKLNAEGLPVIFGYCSTSASTSSKVVSATSSANPFSTYTKNQLYAIEFAGGNTSTAPTININSAGAKTVRHLTTNGASTSNPGTDIFYSQSRGIGVFVYDGTYMIPLAYVSRYKNASEIKMIGYSKPGTVSAITSSDTVLSAIGKLEKAVESASGSGGMKAWTNFGTAPHSSGAMMFYPEGISEIFIVYSNQNYGKYDSLTEVRFGPVSVVNGMTLPGYAESAITCMSDYIEVIWNSGNGTGKKNYVTVFAR